jgi:hypothetical protein
MVEFPEKARVSRIGLSAFPGLPSDRPERVNIDPMSPANYETSEQTSTNIGTNKRLGPYHFGSYFVSL